MPKYDPKKVHPGTFHMKGLRKLKKFFKTQTAIAESLGISRQLVNDWFCGRQVITLHNAERLERMLQGRVTVLELRPDKKPKVIKKLILTEESQSMINF